MKWTRKESRRTPVNHEAIYHDRAALSGNALFITRARRCAFRSMAGSCSRRDGPASEARIKVLGSSWPRHQGSGTSICGRPSNSSWRSRCVAPTAPTHRSFSSAASAHPFWRAVLLGRREVVAGRQLFAVTTGEKKAPQFDSGSDKNRHPQKGQGPYGQPTGDEHCTERFANIDSGNDTRMGRCFIEPASAKRGDGS